MYKINIKQEFKSMVPLTVEFPPFVVLTGLNGSGKSHFLNAVAQSKHTEITENDTVIANPKLLTTFSSVRNPEATVVNWERDAQHLFDTYNAAKYPPAVKVTADGKPLRFSTDPALVQMKLEDRLGSLNLKKVRQTAENAGKDINDLSLDDFREYMPLDDASEESFLYQNFAHIFMNIFKKKMDNEQKKFRREWLKQEHVTYITDEEFDRRYGNPRQVINNLMEAGGLNYEFNEPTEENLDRSFILKLINKRTFAEINLEDLSSGEKVIMSLTFALYNASLDFEFPQIIILDEPDASLHPSMTKQFLNVVENVFVEERGAKVIMTTHSPSTVALAPEAALFVMNKTEPRIEKTSKDKALSILTEGVPSLSINYENRRQVFVESENDVEFYEKVYGRLKNKLVPEISINFISSGESRTDKNGQPVANCGQVINITNILRKSGNKFIHGIVDWDGKNKNEGYTKVLGENKRYAIENYIFDPIFIAALLLDEGAVAKEDLGLANNENYSDFKNFSKEKLQTICDFIIGKIAEQVSPTENAASAVRYVNGIEVEMPVWYLHHPGHPLEELLNAYLKENFVQLKRFHQPNGIRNQIVEKFIENMPDFISQDILESFQAVQSV